MTYWQSAGINQSLLEAFEAIPREKFVLPGLRRDAYKDSPLPTLRNQSLSQPSTVMVMLQALDIKPGDKVFEIGSGVGYQAALMSHLVGPKGKVVTTEIIPELVQLSKQNIDDLGIENVEVVEADGSIGYEDDSPFDKIVITAACPDIPKPIVQQLKPDGVIIAPVGDLKQQILVKATKDGERLDLEFIGPFVFVPMKGKFGFGEEAEIYY